jgi:hypothetical protein
LVLGGISLQGKKGILKQNKIIELVKTLIKKNYFCHRYYNNKTILYTMEQTTILNGKKNRITTPPKPKKKSKYALWCEKNPNGVLTILDHKAVLQ